MSTMLGDMLVRYRADISDLANKISQAKSDMSSVSATAEKTGGSIFSGFSKGVSGALQFGAQIGQTVFGMQALAQGAIGLGSALLEPNASMEQTTVGFKQLLGSSSAAAAELKDLQSFAANTPFEFPELADSTQKLLAFQYPLKQTKPLLTAIGDALSGLGENTAAKLDQVVSVFGQMKSSAHLMTGDLMQLTSVGINGFQILADQMHKPVSVIKDMLSKGLIPAGQGIEMLRKGMEKTFGGGMAAQATTFNGLLSTFQDNAGAAMRAFTGPLFDKAKDGLIKLGNLVSSKQFQDFATKTGQALGTAFNKIGEGITAAVTFGQKFIAFLNDTSAPAMTLKIAILAIAGGFAAIGIVSFVAAIPALVAGFIAWAISAGAAAIATIAATWPIFAIGAAIAIVVALIILAVTHWGQITKFLQDVWGRFTGWFMGILGQIGAFFTNTWNRMVSGAQQAWAGIVNAVKIGGMLLLAAVFAPIIAIVALFLWLYNHNYYFHNLVEKIKEIFTAGFAWLKEQWNRFTGWLGGIWDGLKGKASDAWGAITDTVKGKTTDAGNALHTGWTNTSNTLSSQWNNFAKFMEKAWQLVMAVLNIIWTKFIGPPLTDLWNRFSSWFGNLAGQAWNWGVNLIQGFINGIQSMFGNVTGTVQNLMSNVASFLGFHSPAKKGPGQEIDIWGPNMVKGFARGIDRAAPTLQASLNALVRPMVGYPIAPSSGGVAIASYGGGGAAGGSHTTIVQFDSVEVARMVQPATDRLARLKLGGRGRAA